MRNDAARLVRALLGAEEQRGHLARILPEGCVVALSRDCACGGEEIAQLLARKLRVRCFDKELLDAVARETRQDRATLERLDERASGKMDAWVYSTLFGRNVSPEDYWRSMSRVILNLAAHGGVIVGRGAHLILARSRAFRVRLTGSAELCAQRMAEKQHIPLKEAGQRVAETNAERHAFIETHFKRSINDAGNYDLVLNTDRFEIPAAVQVILVAMQHAGYPVPQEEGKAQASSSAVQAKRG
ncbi:MAG: cytidylate kinase-like family protein [Planctomycetota bacterium]